MAVILCFGRSGKTGNSCLDSGSTQGHKQELQGNCKLKNSQPLRTNGMGKEYSVKEACQPAQ